MRRTCVIRATLCIVLAIAYGCANNRPAEEALSDRLNTLVIAFEADPDRFTALESSLRSEAKANSREFMYLAQVSQSPRVRMGALGILLQVPRTQIRAFEIGVQDRDPAVVYWTVAASEQVFAEAKGIEALKLKAAVAEARPGADRELVRLAIHHLKPEDRARLLERIVKRNALQSSAVREVFTLLARSPEAESKALRLDLLRWLRSSVTQLES